ncbi:TetR family transcriptional regulator [Streptomyces sp. A0958]|uniref:ScbR family autoregulator-binding transcription factor n=1 Tax=Streptomyces sp. A0958 TaxID=2563101 RepID=UPI00109E80EE|nr:ScbR family autoregulator-binding transcription factor [Streptomyces sp. A0958]THA70025.1 TetR family transcriptional regulator [Streptomyces sp. A0958]
MARQQRAVRTREALIRSAAEIVAREGFAVTSLTGISTRAGVSNGALHFHFVSKVALVEAVEAAALERLRAVLEAPAGARSRLQHLVDVTHALARELNSDVVLRAGFVLCGDVAWAPDVDLRAYWQRWAEGLVREAGAAAELRPGAEPEGIVAAVVGATVGFEVLGARDTVWLASRTVARFWELLLPTLASPGLLGTLDAGGTRGRAEPVSDGLGGRETR